MNTSFLFIGGDQRQLYAADFLAKKGYPTALYGFGERDTFSPGKKYDCFVLPAPVTKDAENIFSPMHHEKIPFSALSALADTGRPKLIIGGGCDFLKTCTYAEIFDLLGCEEYNILNATATAEAAISLAVQNTSFNLRGASALVCGYGKIGKILSLNLSGMGARVYVAARKETDRAYAQLSGFIPLDYSELCSHADKFDIIFNTVPSLIIKEDFIKGLKKRCLITDLASKPGGVDFAAADACGIKHLWALGLPGKYSPETSGEIIAGIILKLTGGR